jgi:Heparinase II/III N-terminus/Heparinase II/III-like protein
VTSETDIPGAIVRAGRGLLLVAVAATLFGIWFPELHHYSVTSRRPEAAEATQLRSVPTDATFAIAARADFGLLLPLSDVEVVTAAQDLLAGELKIPGYPTRRMKRIFDPADLTLGEGMERLGYAGFIIPDVLVRAYQISGDDRYLTAARDFILGWSRYERQQLLPRGDLWGDHAVANRALVLTRFWHAYRQHRTWDAEDARTIIEQVVRVGSMLAADKLFTARTNHGVMQNVGLLQLALAFPVLRESPNWRSIAVTRLGRQLDFYVSDEGVVLEHSAGYHVFGTQLLGLTVDLLTTAGEPVPDAWQDKRERALRFEKLLLRPDGTLPAFGDTAAFDDRHARLATAGVADPCSREDLVASYPGSGYAIWWTQRSGATGCDARQLVTAWSAFATGAHKHPDEMSVLFWAGAPWWSSVGYWPYDSPLRDDALGWRSSNAPHWLGENPRSTRRTRAVLTGEKEGVRYLQLLSEMIPQPGQMFRQIIEVDGRLWLIIDSAAPPANIETIWTSYRDVHISTTGALAFKLQSNQADRQLLVTFASTSQPQIMMWNGDKTPLLGWIAGQAERPEVVAAPALSVRAQLGAPSVTAWTMAEAGGPSALSVSIQRWEGEAKWGIGVRLGEQDITVARAGSDLSIAGPPRHGRVLRLSEVADPSSARQRIDHAYQALAAQYPYFKDLLPWRWRATWAALLLPALALFALWLVQRWLEHQATRRRTTLILGAAYTVLLIGFVMCAIYLVFGYLRT